MALQLVVDPRKCKACRSCELACSFGHYEQFNPRLSNVTVFHYEQEAITVPLMCMQCDEASCVKVCPTRALTRNAQGVVVHDPERCLVCKLCVSACPLGNISYAPLVGKIIKCDLCEGDPLCVKFCPSGAITLVDPTEVPDKKSQAAARLKDAVLEEV